MSKLRPSLSSNLLAHNLAPDPASMSNPVLCLAEYMVAVKSLKWLDQGQYTLWAKAATEAMGIGALELLETYVIL